MTKRLRRRFLFQPYKKCATSFHLTVDETLFEQILFSSLILISFIFKNTLFGSGGPAPAGKSGGKGKKGKVELVDGTMVKDFRTEYAKSGASTCKSCEEKIPKVNQPGSRLK